MDKNEGQTELSVEELYQLVWEKPMQALSKDFGISDVGLAKICKRHNIPHPERGYWAKLYSGRKMKKPPLPKAARRNDIVCINRTETIEIPFDVPSSSQKIVIAPILESPHPLIELAKKNMRFSKHGHAFSESPDKMRCLNIKATVSTFDRALRIMDAIIKALEQEGLYVKIDAHGSTCIAVGEEEVNLSIREVLKKVRVELDPKKDQFLIRMGSTHRTDYVPSGRLYLELNEYTGVRSKWRDTDKRLLDDSLGDFILCVQTIAAVLRQRHIDNEVRKQREQEERQREYEENRRESALERQLANFTYCETLRNYARSLREGIIAATGKLPEGIAASWIEWIEDRADAHDPIADFIEQYVSSDEVESGN